MSSYFPVEFVYAFRSAYCFNSLYRKPRVFIPKRVTKDMSASPPSPKAAASRWQGSEVAGTFRNTRWTIALSEGWIPPPEIEGGFFSQARGYCAGYSVARHSSGAPEKKEAVGSSPRRIGGRII